MLYLFYKLEIITKLSLKFCFHLQSTRYRVVLVLHGKFNGKVIAADDHIPRVRIEVYRITLPTTVAFRTTFLCILKRPAYGDIFVNEICVCELSLDEISKTYDDISRMRSLAFTTNYVLKVKACSFNFIYIGYTRILRLTSLFKSVYSVGCQVGRLRKTLK